MADREFASGKFFRWLNKKNLPFYIRIKEGSMLEVKDKKFHKAKKLFSHLNPKKHDVFSMNVTLFGANVYLAGSRSEKGELMIVATNQPPQNAIVIYLHRGRVMILSCTESLVL